MAAVRGDTASPACSARGVDVPLRGAGHPPALWMPRSLHGARRRAGDTARSCGVRVPAGQGASRAGWGPCGIRGPCLGPTVPPHLHTPLFPSWGQGHCDSQDRVARPPPAQHGSGGTVSDSNPPANIASPSHA